MLEDPWLEWLHIFLFFETIGRKTFYHKVFRMQHNILNTMKRSVRFRSFIDFGFLGFQERFDETRSEFHSKRLSVENALNAYEGSPKIVEVDTYRPRSRSRRISDSGEDPYYQYVSSSFPCPVPTRISVPDCRNLHHYEWSFTGDEFKCCTAQSTPRFANSTRSNAPVTPAKSACGEGFFRAYSNCPNYMSNTQSFRAKVRSQSAPKQRPEPGSKKRLSLSEIMESRASLSGVRMQRSCTQVQEDLEF